MNPGIISSVARLYTTFPYPRYPLLARPRWQDGYLSSSLFAARLRSTHTLASKQAQQNSAVCDTQPESAAPQILLGGAGEILPYIVRRWEPKQHHVVSVDLSRPSLMRARLRLGWVTPRTQFVQADLSAWLSQRQRQGLAPLQHIDAYGVIHHMSDPGEALKLLAANLADGGSMRLMVYNSPARTWIHQLQSLLRIFRISPYSASDRQFARHLIQRLADHLPSLGQRLRQIGPSTLSNEARFVDTFLHPREAKVAITHWGSLLAAAGLEAYALFDRYAELDDLKNPLWHMPDWQDLSKRAADARFENNLEIFVAKSGDSPPTANTPLPRRLLLKPPPLLWFNFNETRHIDHRTRWALWHAFLRHASIEPLQHRLTRPALQRLARIGAILPSQLAERSIAAIAAARMSNEMEAPLWPRPSPREQNEALLTIKTAIQERGLANHTRAFAAAQARLLRLARL